MACHRKSIVTIDLRKGFRQPRDDKAELPLRYMNETFFVLLHVDTSVKRLRSNSTRKLLLKPRQEAGHPPNRLCTGHFVNPC